MSHYSSRRLAGFPFALAFLAAAHANAAQTTSEDVASSDIAAVSIDSGFVILAGKYIPPPYKVSIIGDDLFVNEMSMGPVSQAAQSVRPGPGRRGGFRGGGPGFRDIGGGFGAAATSAKSMMEQALLNDGVIIGFEDGTITIDRNAYAVLETLLSSETTDDKLRSLSYSGRNRVTLGQWNTFIGNFEATQLLQDRFAAMKEARSVQRARVKSATSVNGNALYSMTVIGMLLTVSAFGVVLGHHPKSGQSWRAMDDSPEAVRLVLGCAVLIVLLSVFDLVLTLVFRESAGFWEVNPIGSAALGQPAILTVFKLIVTAISVSILVALRRQRIAQLTSWWVCIGLTLLAARWVAFNSMLLS